MCRRTPVEAALFVRSRVRVINKTRISPSQHCVICIYRMYTVCMLKSCSSLFILGPICLARKKKEKRNFPRFWDLTGGGVALGCVHFSFHLPSHLSIYPLSVQYNNYCC